MSNEDTTGLLETESKLQEIEVKINPKEDLFEENIEKIPLTKVQLLLSSIVALLSGICFGYDIGITSNWILPVANSYYCNFICLYVINLNCTEELYVVTPWFLGAILSSIFGGIIIDAYGRKWTIIISTLLVAASTSFVSCANVVLFTFSRFLSGFAGPLSAIVVNIYIAETSEESNRGFKICLHQLGISFGGLLICFAGFTFGNSFDSWDLLMATKIILAVIIVFITLWKLPESQEFVVYQQTKAEMKKTKSYNIHPTILLLTIILACAQRLTGRYIIPFYAPRLFTLLGICMTEATNIAVTTMTVIKFVSTAICLLIVDRLGRRITLIMSFIIMMITLAMLSIIAYLDGVDKSVYYLQHERSNSYGNDPYSISNPPPYPMLPTPLSLTTVENYCPEGQIISTLNSSLRIIAVMNLVLYQVAEALGIGTLIWVLLTEFLPTSIRGRVICAVSVLFWMDFVSPILLIEIGLSMASCLLIYSLTCLTSAIIIFIFLPETKNKTFHEIALGIRQKPICQTMLNIMCFSNNQFKRLPKIELSRLGIGTVKKGTNI